MATHRGDVTPQMINILVAVAAEKPFKSNVGVVPKMVEMGLLEYGETDVVLTAEGAKIAREETEKRSSRRRSSKRKTSKVSKKSSAKKSSKRSSARKSPAKTSKTSKRSSVRKTSNRRSSAPKSPQAVAVGRGPYTEGDVARFNALTWYPRTVEQWNQSYWEDVEQLTNWAQHNLERWGVDGLPEDVDHALTKYRAALYQQGMASIRSREVAPPWTVTGRANYRGKPEKARAIDQKAHEAVKHARHGVEKALGRYSPRAAISSDDPEAVAKLQAKIAKLEATQETMKAANAIVRKKKLTKEQKIEQLSAIEGISTATARELLEPDFAGRLGFPSYAIQNNNANIRRMQERVEELQKRSEMTDRTFEFDGGTMEINVADNRVQIFFHDGKPDESIRKNLKSHGFKWAPSVGAWQRMMSEQALYWAKDVLQKHGKPVTETTQAAPAAVEQEPEAPSTGAFGAMFATIETMEERRAEQESESAAPVGPELLITDEEAFAKLTELEGSAWAKREKADAVEPNTFFDARDAYQILIDDGMVGKKIKDPDTGELRAILIGDITGSAGFVGAEDEIYVVLADGQVALFADTASKAKLAKARGMLKILGDPLGNRVSPKSERQSDRVSPKSERQSDRVTVARLRKGQTVRIVSRELRGGSRIVETTTDAIEIPGGLAVYTTSGQTRAAPSGGSIEWRPSWGIRYQPTMTQPMVPVDRLEVVTSPDVQARLDAFRKIVESKSAGKIDGYEVYPFTALVVTRVYDRLSEANQKKLMAMSVSKIIETATKIHKKAD